MKHTYYTLAIITGLLTSCEDNIQTKQVEQKTTYVTTVQKMASDGLNLKAVTDLSTKVKTAQEFEKKLNEPGNSINNLDLNEDKVIDFIKITEINDKTGKGFSLSTEVTPNEEQELAVIQFEEDKETQTATVQTTGNSNIYGNHHHYHNSFGLSDVLIWSYLLGGHRPYFSPWGFNRQPDYYDRRSPMDQGNYRNYHERQDYNSRYKSSTRSAIKSPLQSPNYNKTAKSIKAPLRNPSKSQRAFQARNPSKTLNQGKGFGRKTVSGRSSSTSPNKGTGFGQKSSSSTQNRATGRGTGFGGRRSTSTSRGTGFGRRSARYGSSRSSRSSSSFGGGK